MALRPTGRRHPRVVVLAQPPQCADLDPAVILTAEFAAGQQLQGLHRPGRHDHLLVRIRQVRGSRRGPQKQWPKHRPRGSLQELHSSAVAPDAPRETRSRGSSGSGRAPSLASGVRPPQNSKPTMSSGSPTCKPPPRRRPPGATRNTPSAPRPTTWSGRGHAWRCWSSGRSWPWTPRSAPGSPRGRCTR